MMRPGEIIVDSFAGGGGASLGISWALGRCPDIAINHDREAIALHAANHPESVHYAEDIWKVDPVSACAGRPVGLMWLSPDCKHFSKAKGGAPVSKRVRGLAWVAVRWAAAVKPRVIVLENVEEFQTWGPVLETGKPCPDRKGKHFQAFKRSLQRLGYVVDHRELRACNFGTPTIRRRLFLVARCDGAPITWPKATHGEGLIPWRTAGECIDWSIPCPSIFTRSKPLAENTLKRIARGLRRFVIESPRPFLVQYHSAKRIGDDRIADINTPLRTQSTENRFGLIAPTLVARYGEADGQAPRARRVDLPMPTVVPTSNGGSLVAAFLAKHYGDQGQRPGSGIDEPVSTVTACDHNALVASHLVKFKGTSKDGQPLTEPLHTVQAGGLHYAEVRSFLVAYYGNEKDGGELSDPMRTVTSKERFGLVTVDGQEYAIADIGMRMLAARELYRAQGFPDSYRIDIEYNGKALTKTAQVRMCGNSVCPPMAEAIVRANLGGVEHVVVAA